MDDPYDQVLGMFALAIAAVMLVAGELYLVMRPDPPQTHTPPPPVVGYDNAGDIRCRIDRGEESEQWEARHLFRCCRSTPG
jgi:hypothetical protein